MTELIDPSNYLNCICKQCDKSKPKNEFSKFLSGPNKGMCKKACLVCAAIQTEYRNRYKAKRGKANAAEEAQIKVAEPDPVMMDPIEAIIDGNHEKLNDKVGIRYGRIRYECESWPTRKFLQLQIAILFVHAVAMKLNRPNWNLVKFMRQNGDESVHILINSKNFDIMKIDSKKAAEQLFENALCECGICMTEDKTFNLCDTCSGRTCSECFIKIVATTQKELDDDEDCFDSSIKCPYCRTDVLKICDGMDSVGVCLSMIHKLRTTFKQIEAQPI